MIEITSFGGDDRKTSVAGIIKGFCKKAGLEYDRDYIGYTDSSTMEYKKCATVLEALSLMSQRFTTEFNVLVNKCSFNHTLQWSENGKNMILVVNKLQDSYSKLEKDLDLTYLEVWGLR